jgi:hypothetical protein
MLRFFRQIRQRLLTDNKFSKYLLYAVGEILLVVIGILIAFQVDNWNEERKNEEKVKNILSDIMVELISDIEKSSQIMGYYALRDSTIYLVLNDRLTKKDYEENEILYLMSLTGWRTNFDPTKDAYNNLTRNLDIVPPRYKDILKDLSDLYNRLHQVNEEHNNELANLIVKYSSIKSQNYPWYSDYSPEGQKSYIEFMLNDFRYKNEVRDYRNVALNNQLFWAIRYRQKAVACYKKLAQLLEKSGYDESFVFNHEASENLIGDWEVVGEPETKISFIEDEQRLYYRDNINAVRKEVFWLPPSKLLIDNVLYGTLIKDGDEDLIKFNSFDLKRAD